MGKDEIQLTEVIMPYPHVVQITNMSRIACKKNIFTPRLEQPSAAILKLTDFSLILISGQLNVNIRGSPGVCWEAGVNCDFIELTIGRIVFRKCSYSSLIQNTIQ